MGSNMNRYVGMPGWKVVFGSKCLAWVLILSHMESLLAADLHVYEDSRYLLDLEPERPDDKENLSGCSVIIFGSGNAAFYCMYSCHLTTSTVQKLRSSPSQYLR